LKVLVNPLAFSYKLEVIMLGSLKTPAERRHINPDLAQPTILKPSGIPTQAVVQHKPKTEKAALVAGYTNTDKSWILY
jgi:hypothetical protein